MRTRGTALAWLLAMVAGAHAVDAPLSPGNPIAAGSPIMFSGVGGTNTAGGVHTALAAFEAAIGGANNGGNPAPQTGGFRTINWDAVKLDGTDFGGDTTVIVPNDTVGIPLDRFASRGVFFEEIYAVSGDGFLTANPNVTGRFPAFSPANTFAMFNDNSIGLRLVLPAAASTTPTAAATRGFGAVFLNVRAPNTTSIEYFNGATSLGEFFVPTSASQGDAEFLGVLFDSPIVTSLTITCGTDTLFGFDGTTVTSGGPDSPPTHNLVVTDDFVYAEPATAANAVPAIAATAGALFSGVVVTFSDGDPSGDARNFTAVIDWGDGHLSPGTIQANASGGFDVTGSNTYDDAGTFIVRVDIADFGAASLTVETTANVAAAPTSTTTTTIPCTGVDLDAVACLLGEVPPAACAGQALPARIRKLTAAARTLADRARGARGKRQRQLDAKLAKLLGRAVAAVGQGSRLTGACPAALASLFAEARTRTQAVLAGL